MKDYADAIVVELYVGPVIGLAASRRMAKLALTSLWKSEEIDCQIDQVRPEIEPQARTRASIFAPASADDRAKAIHVALEVGYRPSWPDSRIAFAATISLSQRRLWKTERGGHTLSRERRASGPLRVSR